MLQPTKYIVALQGRREDLRSVVEHLRKRFNVEYIYCWHGATCVLHCAMCYCCAAQGPVLWDAALAAIHSSPLCCWAWGRSCAACSQVGCSVQPCWVPQPPHHAPAPCCNSNAWRPLPSSMHYFAGLSAYWSGVSPNAPGVRKYEPQLYFPKPTPGLSEIEPRCGAEAGSTRCCAQHRGWRELRLLNRRQAART